MSIVVEDLSRLTRDMSEILRLYHRLRLREIELVGVGDGIATGRRGAKTQLAVKGLVNELYLDDLRDKTHGGLSGSVARGLSAGGRIFGYRTIPFPQDGMSNQRSKPARFDIEPAEAVVVRRIFRDYAGGRSMKTIAHGLNAEGVPFPGKDTKRGPARRGWALSTIQVILRSERYAGVWVWNKTRFLKDPDTGRRRPVPRPPQEWVRQERADLRIVEPELWAAVQGRLRFVEAAFGHRRGRRPVGRAAAAYSPYLLSGLLRCGVCSSRMVAATTSRRKGEVVHRYSWYRCSFATTKGPAICAHGAGYRREQLERAMLSRFREAMTPERVEALAEAVNAQIVALLRQRNTEAERVKAEILTLEREAGRLVRFVASGGESPTVRQELQAIEAALVGLRLALADTERSDSMTLPRAQPDWILAKLAHVETLIATDVVRARAEMLKHLDGELVLVPKPSVAGERRAEVTGRVKSNGLLAEQEAVRLELVAGVGFEPTTRTRMVTAGRLNG